MANIKTPDGGFYLDDSQFDVDYEENLVTLIGGGGTGDVDITADGGVFNADAMLQGTDNLEITVPDAGESATIGITPESVTLVHNTDSEADASVRVVSTGVEIAAGDNTISINGTGVNFGGMTITNVASIGGSSGEIAFENNMDMNSHRITNLLAPAQKNDAVNLAYLQGYGSAATATIHGTVLKGAAVTDATGETDIVTQFNALLASLRAAGIISQ